MICNKVTKDHSFSIPPHQPLCLYLCIFHCHCQVWERVLTIRPTRSVVKDNLSPLISHKGDHRYHYYVQCPQWPYYNVHSGEKATSAQPNHRSSLTTSKCSQWRPCRSSMHTNCMSPLIWLYFDIWFETVSSLGFLSDRLIPNNLHSMYSYAITVVGTHLLIRCLHTTTYTLFAVHFTPK